MNMRLAGATLRYDTQLPKMAGLSSCTRGVVDVYMRQDYLTYHR
jgi:hypothetical protein